jgi:hypothetical protein
MYERDALHVRGTDRNTTLTASFGARSLNSYRPRETMPRIRIAAAIERKRMKQFLLDLARPTFWRWKTRDCCRRGKVGELGTKCVNCVFD